MRCFADHHPAAVAVTLLCAAGVCIFRFDPLIIAIGLAGAFVTCWAVRAPGGWRSHLYGLIMFLVFALINPLVSHHGVTVLFVINHNPVTLESCLYGVLAAAMILAVMHFFRAFSAVMTTDKLLCLFGRLSPKIALMLSITLRYVPLFTRQWGDVRRTQTALGLYREDDLTGRAKGGLRIFSVMTTWALENGVVTADSMAGRGYGVGRRTQYRLYPWTQHDTLLLLSALLLTACTLWGFGTRSFTCYPAVAYTAIDLRTLSGCIAYGLLVTLPAIIRGKEAIRWRCLISKT